MPLGTKGYPGPAPLMVVAEHRRKQEQKACALSTNIRRGSGERCTAKPRGGNCALLAEQEDPAESHTAKGRGDRGVKNGPLTQSPTRCNGLFIAGMNIHVF